MNGPPTVQQLNTEVGRGFADLERLSKAAAGVRGNDHQREYDQPKPCGLGPRTLDPSERTELPNEVARE